MILYLDASAIVKVITPERESAALVRTLESWAEQATSGLSLAEVPRALRRIRATSTTLRRAERALEQLNIIRLDRDILDAAGAFRLPGLRTLDAVHLASALSLGGDLEAVVTYDRRLAMAARGAGVTVLAPA
jgi:predicted nucleic acid-binding protein